MKAALFQVRLNAIQQGAYAGRAGRCRTLTRIRLRAASCAAFSGSPATCSPSPKSLSLPGQCLAGFSLVGGSMDKVDALLTKVQAFQPELMSTIFDFFQK